MTDIKCFCDVFHEPHDSAACIVRKLQVIFRTAMIRQSWNSDTEMLRRYGRNELHDANVIRLQETDRILRHVNTQHANRKRKNNGEYDGGYSSQTLHRFPHYAVKSELHAMILEECLRGS